MALIREGLYYRLSVRPMVRGWQLAVTVAAGAGGCSGWRLTGGEVAPTADLALAGVVLTLGGAPGDEECAGA